jgi:AcrR family transcriptional regulator
MGRPPGVDGEDTIRRILEVAERQFASFGYGTTTNRTIAGECDLSSAALYHHFGTKTALYAAVCANVFPSMVEAYRAALVGVTGLGAQLSTLLEVSIELNARRPSLAGFVMGAPVEARRHPELLGIVEEHFGTVESLVDELIGQARDAGELGDDVGSDDLVDMVISMMQGLAHLAYRGESPERFARAVRAHQRLLAGTLLGPHGSR